MLKQVRTALVFALFALNVAQAMDAARLIYVSDHDIVDTIHSHDDTVSHTEEEDASLHCVHCHFGHLRLAANQSFLFTLAENSSYLITGNCDCYRSPNYAIDHPPC